MNSLIRGLGIFLVVIGNPCNIRADERLEPGGTLIVLNKSDGTASLIACRTGQVFATIPTGEAPHEVAVSPDHKTAVVGNYGKNNPGHTLTVIDLATRKVTKTIDLKKYHRPHGLLFLPDGKRLLVTAEKEQKLLIVDIDRGKVSENIDTAQEISHMVAVTPSADRAFVANIRSGSVSVIDLQSANRISIIETGSGAEGIDVTPDGKEVWVTNRGANTISVIDTASLEVLATIKCSSVPIRIKFTPDGKHALVSNARSGDVAVFDTQERKEVHRVGMRLSAVEKTDDRLFKNAFGDSPVPVGIVIPPDGRHAYVANTNADIITVIDLESWEISGRLTAGKEPDGLGYSPLE